MRSLRTFHLRVPRQSQTATALAQWLDSIAQTPVGKDFDGVPGGIIEKVWHSSLQAKTANWDVAKQMEGGWNATFSFLVRPSHNILMLEAQFLWKYLHTSFLRENKRRYCPKSSNISLYVCLSYHTIISDSFRTAGYKSWRSRESDRTSHDFGSVV